MEGSEEIMNNNMNRLTKKIEGQEKYLWDSSLIYSYKGSTLIPVINKLGKLEDIEDELGCPLDVVFEVFKEGFEYFVHSVKLCVDGDDTGREEIVTRDILELRQTIGAIALKYDGFLGKYVFLAPLDFGKTDRYDIVYLKDYQKTWWLKGESIKCSLRSKLENGEPL